MNKIPSWGVHYTSDIPLAKNWCCQNCGWEALRNTSTHQHCVGFSKEVPSPKICTSNRKKTGGIIFECPRCFEKFWFHTVDVIVEDIMRDKGML